MPQLLKPALLDPMLPNKRSHRDEKPVHRKEESPPLAATRESSHAATKTQHSQKKRKKRQMYVLNNKQFGIKQYYFQCGLCYKYGTYNNKII